MSRWRRWLLSLVAPRELAVLDAVAHIPATTLGHWIRRHFCTYRIAQAELLRRAPRESLAKRIRRGH